MMPEQSDHEKAYSKLCVALRACLDEIWPDGGDEWDDAYDEVLDAYNEATREARD